MSFTLKRINNEKVEKVKFLIDDDKRPIRGYDLFPNLYSNIFNLAKKNTGKTVVTYKIIKTCCSKHTTVIAFCSTLYKDKCWASIMKMCKDKGIPFIGHTSMIDDEGVDQLALLVNYLSNKAKARYEAQLEKEDRKKKGYRKEKKINPILMNESSDDEDQDEDDDGAKARAKSKFQEIEYMIIFDDLSTELKFKSFIKFMKENRHFLCKTVINTQWLCDLPPSGRKQIDYALVFKGQSRQKLEEIYKDCSLNVEPEEYFDIYDTATEKPYSFLYIDSKQCKFRQNFDKEYQLD